MNTLLPVDHPTVIRRLCKELNYRPAGFYVFPAAAGECLGRFNQARFSKGALQVCMGRGQWITVTPADHTFDDGNGGTICASRTK